ncbi:alpha/beta hydrolase [Photobacterium piscicola]|uniref:alpha/beta hydrolase n=3 Tax=Photobacterium piscicola TaxID=1378299 RepID=UPI003736273C
MRKLTVLLFFTIIPLLTLSCSTGYNNPKPLHLSKSYYDYLQPTFTDYLKVTKSWLTQHRSFISTDHERELSMNMPFERGNKHSNKAILLVHGLGDSPHSFSDLASTFAAQGFYVQVLLLPGHGSSPKDILLTTYSDWQNIVDHYTNLLHKNHQKVWLGGFSTGANLVSINSLKNKDIAGLVLISPGFKSVNPILEKFSSFAALFWDGIAEQEDNFAKYNSMPLHGMAEYSKSAVTFREKIAHKQITIPTLIAVSEADSIINTHAIADIFSKNFSNPNSKFIWYGKKENLSLLKRKKTYSMFLTSQKISTASHMSPLFSPSNYYYGKNGEKLICKNSLDDTQTELCKRGENIWFSAWGYKEKGKVHARLTWNPYFDALENEIKQIIKIDGSIVR